jgi:hypothetical protein
MVGVLGQRALQSLLEHFGRDTRRPADDHLNDLVGRGRAGIEERPDRRVHLREPEPRRQDRGYGIGTVLDPERRSHDVRAAVEQRVPHAIAEDCRGGGGCGASRDAKFRIDAEHTEEIGRHRADAQRVRAIDGSHVSEASRDRGGNAAFERRIVVPGVVQRAGRRRGESVRRRAIGASEANDRELVGIAVQERRLAEHDVADRQRDGGGADPERERDDRDGGRDGIARDAAHRGAHVLAQTIEPHPAVRFVEAFLDARHVAEGAARREARRFGRHPVRDQPIGLDLQVRADFVRELVSG